MSSHDGMDDDDDDFFQEDEEKEDSQMEQDDDDFEDDDDNESDHSASFSPVIADRDIQKAYQVDFRVLSPKDLQNTQDDIVRHIVSLLGCEAQTGAALLRYFKWNKERLIEQYLENPTEISEAAGVILQETLKPKFMIVKDFTCDICCDDSTNLQTLALSCGHRFCKGCYEEYLTQKIIAEGESRKITCPGHCSLVVDEGTIGMVVKQNVLERYRHLLMRTYVDDHPYLRWCPAPNCEYAVECKVSIPRLKEIVPTVTCACGQVFCFGCSHPSDHQPCICALVKKWIKKCADDSETSNWISAHTKECIKCDSTIEKNGGCNHMTCKKCSYEFCWICLGPWSEHGTQFYTCNRYTEKASVDARDQQAKSRAALEKYLHYYNRYMNHEQSAKLDKELYEKTEKKMEEMQKNSELSWIEVQYMKKAVEVLLTSRGTLKWTYAFAYYLEKNNATMLFEDNQRDLEMAVEHLSEMLEKPIDPASIMDMKQSVLDKMVYVGSRREVLLTDTIKGLSEGRWTYNVEV